MDDSAWPRHPATAHVLTDPPRYPTAQPAVNGPSRQGALVVGALWVLSLLAPGGTAVVEGALHGGGLPHGATTIVWVLVVAAAVLTLVEGALLARARWSWGVPVLAVAGTAGLSVLYVAAMVAGPHASGSSDDLAAVGLVLGVVPVFIVLAAVLAVGFVVGLVADRLRRPTTAL